MLTFQDIYIVMELCDSDVQKHLNIHHRLSPDEVKNLVLQMAGASKYLVGHKVIHRDIKPANILIKNNSNANGRLQYKLADFGCVSCIW